MATATRLTLKLVIMARYFKYIILLTSSIFLLISCQEGGDAGDLWGQWRMDGSDSKYISFSGSITMVKDVGVTEVYGNFQHQGDSLMMQYYSKKGELTDTMVVEQSFGFKPINNVRVKIATLDSDHLVLTKDGQTWSFYKY